MDTSPILADFEQLLLANLPSFEGEIAWLYLDTHQPPIATVGEGNALSTLSESLLLPWMVGARAATPKEIQADWLRVTGMRGGMVASAYAVEGGLRLTTSAINMLTAKRFAGFTEQLQEMFPEFNTWPVQAKAATLDMIYQLGEGRMPGPGQPAKGLMAYAIFRAAAARQDWETCKAQCAIDASNKSFSARNGWLEEMFQQAADAAATPKR